MTNGAQCGLRLTTHRLIQGSSQLIPQSHGLARRPVRTVFVSDIHLGCRHSQAAAFLRFLESIQPRQLYLVGDFIDGWKLRRRWRWNPIYTRILLRLSEMAHGGTRIFFTPGNHDDFLRDPVIREVVSMGLVRIRDEFVHQLADGRRFLVLHGDRFDRIETGARWMSVVASMAYDSLLAANAFVCGFSQLATRQRYSLGAAVKRRVKRIVNFISEFESRLVAHADELGCAGIICGHIHTPTMVHRGDVLYCNTGDWVENCTALIEEESGCLELVECRADGKWKTLSMTSNTRPITNDVSEPLMAVCDECFSEECSCAIPSTNSNEYL